MGQAFAKASRECIQRMQSCHRVPEVQTTALVVHGPLSVLCSQPSFAPNKVKLPLFLLVRSQIMPSLATLYVLY